MVYLNDPACNHRGNGVAPSIENVTVEPVFRLGPECWMGGIEHNKISALSDGDCTDILAERLCAACKRCPIKRFPSGRTFRACHQVAAAMEEALALGVAELERWGARPVERRTPLAAREAVTLDELALTAYEAQRPAAEEACRLGDERFFPENH